MSMIRGHVKAWESVPRVAAEDLRLSVSTCGVLFWLLTRPADGNIRIGALMRLTGISKHTWPKIRDELIAAGYLVAKKGRAVGGQITWNFDVYSVSIKPLPDLPSPVNRVVVDEPSPALPGMVKPSTVNRGTTDTVITDTVINNKEAHTSPPPPFR